MEWFEEFAEFTITVIEFVVVLLVYYITLILVMGSLVPDSTNISSANFFLQKEFVLGLTVGVIVAIILTHLTYWVIINQLERRELTEFDMKYFVEELGFGLVLGTLLICVVFVIIYIARGYSIEGISSNTQIIGIALISLNAAYIEELAFRGILLRRWSDQFGKWTALGITGLLFGLIHIINPSATILSTINIMLTGGILLGLLYLLTNRLWVVIGFHFAWNFVQGGLFDLPISGVRGKGLLDVSISGPRWLSGGKFGPEASAVILLVYLIPVIYYTRKLYLKSADPKHHIEE